MTTSATPTFLNGHYISFLTREQLDQLLSDIATDHEHQRQELLAPLRQFAGQR